MRFLFLVNCHLRLPSMFMSPTVESCARSDARVEQAAERRVGSRSFRTVRVILAFGAAGGRRVCSRRIGDGAQEDGLKPGNQSPALLLSAEGGLNCDTRTVEKQDKATLEADVAESVPLTAE